MTTIALQDMAKLLDQDDNYKVIKRFEPVRQYHMPSIEQKHIGIFVDTETTGLNYQTDKIIEIALVAFEYTSDGRIFSIVDSYSCFQDPGFKIPEHITALTGINDEMVKGQSIDLARVSDIVSEASIIIAHNAAFDRKFLEVLSPVFKLKAWGCTSAQIPWQAESITSAKLEYIAYRFGFFYEAHRAEIDCLAGIHILTQTLPISNRLVFAALLEISNSKSYRIWANNSPFHCKDILKARGYRWHDGLGNKPKSWYKDVVEQFKEEEIKFLEQEIYRSKVLIAIDEICPLSRFSDRM